MKQNYDVIMYKLCESLSGTDIFGNRFNRVKCDLFLLGLKGLLCIGSANISRRLVRILGGFIRPRW